MRRILSVLLIALATAVPAWAVEPKADLKPGPETVPVGQIVIYDVSGSVSDPETPLRAKVKGPGSPSVQVWYDAKQKPGLLVLTPAAPGRYTILVYATGVPEGAKAPSLDFDEAVLEVVASPTPPTPPVPPMPPPVPIGDHDPAFVPIGKAFAASLARDFAASYEAGTKLLAAGQTRPMAAETASREFSAARQKSFEAIASPALSRVIDPAKAESDITPAERAAMVRARRGISMGAISP